MSHRIVRQGSSRVSVAPRLLEAQQAAAKPAKPAPADDVVEPKKAPAKKKPAAKKAPAKKKAVRK